jgi:hypothetical protein
MFIRKKKNRSDAISVVVASKSHGEFKALKNFGVAHTESEAENLHQIVLRRLKAHEGQQVPDFGNAKGLELEETRRVISNMDAVLINGTQLLPDRIYDAIGFNRIPDDILRHPVISRVSQPASKLAATENLKSYYDEDIDLNNIYRYMDKMYNNRQSEAA